MCIYDVSLEYMQDAQSILRVLIAFGTNHHQRWSGKFGSKLEKPVIRLFLNMSIACSTTFYGYMCERASVTGIWLWNHS